MTARTNSADFGPNSIVTVCRFTEAPPHRKTDFADKANKGNDADARREANKGNRIERNHYQDAMTHKRRLC
jgi:hypothetical protein